MSGPLSGFTAERNVRAKAARADGDRDLAARIGALPKPSVAAWLVDLLVRAAPDELQRVLDLGAALQEAQDGSDGPRLRELAAERRSLLAEVAASTASLAEAAGQRVGPAALEELQQTLQAALASPAAAAAVRTGRLVRALDADGLDPVDLDDAVAGSAPDDLQAPPGPARTRAGRRGGDDVEHGGAGRARREAEEQRRTEERDRRLGSAREQAERTAAEARAATATAEDRQRDAADLRQRVEELRTRLDRAERARAEAESAATAARERADDAAAAIDRLAADR